MRSTDGHAAEPSCEGWDTEGFFETAAAEDVTACLAARADVGAQDEDSITPLTLIRRNRAGATANTEYTV